MAFGSTSLSRVLSFFPGRDAERDPRFQHVLEQLPAAAFFVAPRAGTFLAINGKAAALTEWTRDELMRQSLSEIIVVPQGEAALEQFYAMEPGNVRHLSAVPLRTRSGRLALADLRLSALDDPERGETLVLALATPVEERLAHQKDKAQQDRILETMDQLLTLFASSTEGALELAIQVIREMLGADAIGLYRVRSDAPGLHLKYADGVPPGFTQTITSDQAAYLLNPLSWSSGQRTEAFIAQSARMAGWTHFIAYPVGEPPYIVGSLFVAYRLGNPPSSQAPALLAVAARHIHHLIAQITREANYLNAQRLAFTLSSQLVAINAQIEEGVVLINDAGMIDEFNNAAARMFGYRSEEVTGLPCDDVLVAEGQLNEAIRRSRGDGSAGEFEGVLHRRGGEAFPAFVRLQPLAVPSGGCVLILHDLSEARASEVRQEHLDQLAYMGQATQSFAHEVRGPLNNIAMGVQYLAARLPTEDSLQSALSKIQAECNRLSSLMNDMLAWAKPVDPKLEPTDLAQFLKRLLNRWSAKIAQRNVRLNFTAVEDCPPVLADPRLIEQVFVNLIDNALQAMPAGGHLSISLRLVSRRAQGNFVEARVADSGPGIPEEIRRRIFDPYFTTKPDGTGLGLAICKRLVTIHRGVIAIESFPGTGTIFTVTLPAHDKSV